MGATCRVMRISAASLGMLQAQPNAVELFVCCYRPVVPLGFPEAMREAFLSDPCLVEFRRESIEWLIEDFPELADALIPETNKPHVNLDKAWGEIEEFLQGQPNGAVVSRSVFGGTELGRNLGYGPARFLGVKEVREIADALQTVSDSGLSHPMLREQFGQLKAYYREAAASGNAMLQSLG